MGLLRAIAVAGVASEVEVVFTVGAIPETVITATAVVGAAAEIRVERGAWRVWP